VCWHNNQTLEWQTGAHRACVVGVYTSRGSGRRMFEVIDRKKLAGELSSRCF
jgi:hypothetical protein